MSFDLVKPTLDNLLAVLRWEREKGGERSGGKMDQTCCFTSTDSIVMVPSLQKPLWNGETSNSNLPPHVEAGMTFDNVREGHIWRSAVEH